MDLSYSSGASDQPLLSETIGANFQAAVAAFGSREALVDRPSGRRWTYDELAAEVEAVALGLLALGVRTGDRVGIWAPNCAEWVFVQYATARSGRSSSTSIRPTGSTSWSTCSTSRGSGRSSPPMLMTSDYAAMIAEVRPACPALLDVVLFGERRVGGAARGRARRGPAALAAIVAALTADDPINIQYTSGRRDSPRARRSRTTTSSTTATSSASCAATPSATASASRCPSTTASAW